MTTPSELRAIAAEFNTTIHTWSGTPRAAEAAKQALLFETLATLLEMTTTLDDNLLYLTGRVEALYAAQKNPSYLYTNPGANATAVLDPGSIIDFKTSDSPTNIWEGRTHS